MNLKQHLSNPTQQLLTSRRQNFDYVALDDEYRTG
jgi:hypothetical protein